MQGKKWKFSSYWHDMKRIEQQKKNIQKKTWNMNSRTNKKLPTVHRI